MGSRSARGGEQGAPEGIVGKPPLSFLLLESLLPVRGSELEDAASGPIGQQVEQIAKVGPGLDVVQLAAREEGDEDGIGKRTILGTYEGPIFSADRKSQVILPMSRFARRSTTRGTLREALRSPFNIVRGVGDRRFSS